MGVEPVDSASEDDCYDDRPRTMSLTKFCKQVLQDNIHHENSNPIVFAPEPLTDDGLDCSLDFAEADVLVENNVMEVEEEFGELN